MDGGVEARTELTGAPNDAASHRRVTDATDGQHIRMIGEPADAAKDGQRAEAVSRSPIIVEEADNLERTPPGLVARVIDVEDFAGMSTGPKNDHSRAASVGFHRQT
jgi:hypothetical protein